MKNPELLSASQVARRLGISSARVNQLRKEGKLAAQETPIGYLYSREDIENLAKARQAGEIRKDTNG